MRNEWTAVATQIAIGAELLAENAMVRQCATMVGTGMAAGIFIIGLLTLFPGPGPKTKLAADGKTRIVDDADSEEEEGGDGEGLPKDWEIRGLDTLFGNTRDEFEFGDVVDDEFYHNLKQIKEQKQQLEAIKAAGEGAEGAAAGADADADASAAAAAGGGAAGAAAASAAAAAAPDLPKNPDHVFDIDLNEKQREKLKGFFRLTDDQIDVALYYTRRGKKIPDPTAYTIAKRCDSMILWGLIALLIFVAWLEYGINILDEAERFLPSEVSIVRRSFVKAVQLKTSLWG